MFFARGKRIILSLFALIIGVSQVLLFAAPASADPPFTTSYKYIDAKTIANVATYRDSGTSRSIRVYTADLPMQISERTTVFEANVEATNGGICRDNIELLSTGAYVRVTRTQSGGSCQQSSETRTVISVETTNRYKFFTQNADGSLTSIGGKSLIRNPSDATIFVENNQSTKCPIMLRKTGRLALGFKPNSSSATDAQNTEVWGVVLAETKPAGNVDFDSEGRTEAYQNYAENTLQQDTYGDCQIGGNDQKRISREGMATLLGGSASDWEEVTGSEGGAFSGGGDYISIKPFNENHDGVPFGDVYTSIGGDNTGFVSWGNPIVEYVPDINNPMQNCDLFLNRILREACQDGMENDGATYCDNTYRNFSYPEEPTGEERANACIVGQTIAVNGATTPDINQGGCTQAEIQADDCEDNAVACGIEGIGWIVCPVLTFLGGVADSAFETLADNFLSVRNELVETGGQTQDAWAVMRNVANVAFVIAFLIIIFSQLTGVGVSNYGVKKLLPRVIISAILVNLSFIICQIAVDVSNILGYSIKQVFDAMDTTLMPASQGDATGNGFGWAVLILGIIAAGVGVLLAITVPVLLASLLAVLMIVLILFARQALIVILIIVSPLAFVAYLLPNTEQWFKKWAKLFSTLLLLFPIIAVVFGASALAANIIKGSSEETMIQIVAIGVATVPFFAVPFLLKGALDGAGKIGSTLSGLASRAGGNVGKQVKDTSRLSAYKNAWDRQRQQKRALILGGQYKGKGPLARMSSGISSALNNQTGKLGTTVARQGKMVADKLEVEDIEAAKAIVRDAQLTEAEVDKLVAGGKVKGLNGRDAATTAAMAEHFAETGKFDRLAKVFDQVGSGDASRDRNNAEARRMLSNTMLRSKSKPGFMGAGALADYTGGANLTLRSVAQAGVAANSYGPLSISTTSSDELRYAFQSSDAAGRARLQAAAQAALANPEIAQNITKNVDWINFFAGGSVGTPPS
jgi:hypothetical protein